MSSYTVSRQGIMVNPGDSRMRVSARYYGARRSAVGLSFRERLVTLSRLAGRIAIAAAFIIASVIIVLSFLGVSNEPLPLG